MIPTLEEVGYYLRGIWLMVRNDPAGFAHLDISNRGFWRSFWAYFYAIPAFLYYWVSDRDIYLLDNPGASAGFGFLVKLAATDLISIVLMYVLIALLARPLHMSSRYAQWVIAANWLSLGIVYVQVFALFLSRFLSKVEAAGALLLLLTLIAALVASYRVYRVVLNGDSTLAFGVLVISELSVMVMRLAVQ